MTSEQLEALAAAIAGTGTNRDRVYAALKEAGDRGITRDELWKLAGGGVGIHVESLRYEGHVINDVYQQVSPGRREHRMFLREDAWAGDE